MEGQFQHSPGGIVAHLAIWLNGWEGVEASSAGAYDELADATARLGQSAWTLRRETLVAVVVSGQHNVGPVIVESLPQWLDTGAVPMST